MRMTHYYLVLALLLAPLLLATTWTGATHEGADTHLKLGLVTAILCVTTNTALILFMIVTGRVLKQAVAARALPAEFLTELNEFFARKQAYPLALLGAVSAVATAVLGYGGHIGVSAHVHVLVAIVTVPLNLYVLPLGLRTLRENQRLLDHAAGELDRADAGAEPRDEDAGEPEWRFPRRTRLVVFALSAWLPYLYWGLVVWRGDFGRVPRLFLVGTALVSAFALVRAGTRGATDRHPA